MDELISREAVKEMMKNHRVDFSTEKDYRTARACANAVPPAEPKRGKWIQDRSGAYCCSECMEPCAGYVMMKPRDKFCKMCGSRNEVTE